MLFLIFAIGGIIGSFINVLIDRSILEESIIYPPSHCDYCNMRLRFINLIPIISFILQKGKCTYCGKKIKIQYPIIEFSIGLMFLFNTIIIGNILTSLIISMSIALLLGMSIIDIRTKEIYVSHILALLLINIGIMIFTYERIEDYIYKIILIILMVSIGYLLSKKEKVGFGDILILAILLINLSFDNILFYFLSLSIIGLIIAIIFLLKYKDLKYQLPFVPIISLSYYIVVLYIYINTI